MKILFVLLITSSASVVGADAPVPGHAVEFSKYSPTLKLVSYDKNSDTFNFQGTLKLVGTLFVEFEMETQDKASGDITFEKFVPDASSTTLLPAVVGGFYPAPVRYLDLDLPQEQVEALFGKTEFQRLAHGTQSFVSKRVSLTLHQYSVTVECDSRLYLAREVSVAPLDAELFASLTGPPHGC